MTDSAGIVQVNKLIDSSKHYWYLNHDSAMYFAKRVLSHSREIHYSRGEGEAYRSMGFISNDSAIAKSYFDKALSFFITIHDKKGIADTYNNLGLMLQSKNDSMALIAYDSALILFREIKDKVGESAVLNYINILYKDEGNYQKAIDYALLGLDIRKNTNDYKGIVWSMLNVGDVYLEGGQLESAKRFFLEAEQFTKEHQMEPFTTTQQNLARVYLIQEKYDSVAFYLSQLPYEDHLLLGELYDRTGKEDSAIVRFRMGLKAARERNDKDRTMAFLIGLGQSFLKTGNYDQAFRNASEAYKLSDSRKKNAARAKAANILAACFERTRNFAASLHYTKEANQILDSINSKYNENFQHKLAIFESKDAIESEQA
ncbi:MAG: tetratricopeptide repeat protein, partial [Chitinophagales bacterium]